MMNHQEKIHRGVVRSLTVIALCSEALNGLAALSALHLQVPSVEDVNGHNIYDRKARPHQLTMYAADVLRGAVESLSPLLVELLAETCKLPWTQEATPSSGACEPGSRSGSASAAEF
ncbi:MAG: hypothetical protein KatS3mg005_4135 [Bryobacteraceae bacterium]|nr:MAG: hypothetical protein KatS3mg005_4135 [Bryobacteraceae bacterium]